MPAPQGTSFNRNDSVTKCFYYGRIGHIARYCMKKKFDEGWKRHRKHASHFVDEEQSHNIRMFISDFALLAKEDEADTWFVDSSAYIHMTGNNHLFEDFKETNSGSNIYLGDDRGYQIKGYGNIPVVFPDGNIRHIHNVMYVPRIKKNLISISTVTHQNVKVEFYNCIVSLKTCWIV